MRKPRLDLVVPVYNEEELLGDFVAALQAQTDLLGRRLPANTLRLIVVDSFSTDRTLEVLEASTCGFMVPETILLQELEKNHIAARMRGCAFALSVAAKAERPILVSADADTPMHPWWLACVLEHLASGSFDALTCAGTFPASFWVRLPKLVRRYAEEIGTIFFPSATVAEFGIDASRMLFSEDMFYDIGRMPSDCALAIGKDAFEQAGGYRREYWKDGREILAEGWNLKFRLDARGVRIGYEGRTPYTTSARRMLQDAEKLLEGTAYLEGMSKLRGTSEEVQYQALESLSDTYDFAKTRRYVVRNYILLKAITEKDRPELRRYLGLNSDRIMTKIANSTCDTAADIYDLADQLLEEHFESIIFNLRHNRYVGV